MTLLTQFWKLIFENMQRNCWQYILQNLEAKADYKLVTRISTHKAWQWKESLHKVTKDMVDLPAHKALKFICFQPQQFVQFRTWPHQPFSQQKRVGETAQPRIRLFVLAVCLHQLKASCTLRKHRIVCSINKIITLEELIHCVWNSSHTVLDDYNCGSHLRLPC